MKGYRSLILGSLLLSATLLTGCTRQVKDSPPEARNIGKFKLSVYWLANERWYPGPRISPLYRKGKRLAWVSEGFARAIRMQGSGRLRNGWLVQYRGKCRYKRSFCLRVKVLSRRKFPMGVGAAGIPLRPLRSLAVDTRRVRFGTKLYIPALGRLIRSSGKRHNGCFIAHDRGGKIKGRRLDLFTGSRRLYKKHLGVRTPQIVRVYVAHPKCAPAVARPSTKIRRKRKSRKARYQHNLHATPL